MLFGRDRSPRCEHPSFRVREPATTAPPPSPPTGNRRRWRHRAVAVWNDARPRDDRKADGEAHPNPRLHPAELRGPMGREVFPGRKPLPDRPRRGGAGRRPFPPALPGRAAPTFPSRSGDRSPSAVTGTLPPAGPARVVEIETKVCGRLASPSLSCASPGTALLPRSTRTARTGSEPLYSPRPGASRGTRRPVRAGRPENSGARPNRRRERRQRRGDALQTVSGAAHSGALHRDDGPESHRVQVLEASSPRIVPRAPRPAFRAAQPLVVTLDFDDDLPGFDSEVDFGHPPRRFQGQDLGEELLAVHHPGRVLPSRPVIGAPGVARRLRDLPRRFGWARPAERATPEPPGPASAATGAESGRGSDDDQPERAARSEGMGRASSR